MAAAELRSQVEVTIRRHKFFENGDGVVVACSGGPDSLTLLKVLHDLDELFHLKLSVVYVDHGLRSEAAKEGRFVAAVADSLGLPAFIEKVPIDLHEVDGQSVQAAAREARYSILRSIANKQGACAIATGHTADDQAETLVMRMVRGTGYTGLAGIPYSNGALRRPILDIRRSQTEAFCRNWGIMPVKDPSNAEDVYLRNRVRHWAMPALAKISATSVESLCRLAETAQVENSWIGSVVEETLRQIAIQDDGGWWCDGQGFLQLHPALQRRVIRRLSKLDDTHAELDFAHVSAALSSIEKRQTGIVETLPGNVVVMCERDGFWVGPASSDADYALPLSVPGQVCIPGTKLVLTSEFQGGTSRAISELEENQGKRTSGPWQPPQRWELLDAETVDGQMWVRNRRPGDRYQPLGLKGSKKVQDIFVDAGVPRRWRGRLPLVADNSGILWVAGCAPAERAKVKAKTTKGVKLQLRYQGEGD